MKQSYDLCVPEGEIKGVVLGIHGFGGSKNSGVLAALRKALADNGYATVTFDLPAHGDNRTDEPLRLDQCVDAVADAVAYARTPGKPLSVFATSFGAYLTLVHIAEEKGTYDRVVLRAPAVYMDETFARLVSWNDHPEAEVWNMSHDDQPLWVDRTFAEALRTHRPEDMQFGIDRIEVLQGTLDDVVDWHKNADFFARHFGDKCRIHYLEGLGHAARTPRDVQAIVEAAIPLLTR